MFYLGYKKDRAIFEGYKKDRGIIECLGCRGKQSSVNALRFTYRKGPNYIRMLYSRIELCLNYICKRIKSRVSSFLTEKRNQP